MKLAEYLFARLRQLGVGSMHGVPGDYNLTLLDYVRPAGLVWAGNANELNAAYAADAYARIKGIGSLITTFGVGELSAINAIAGAYAERAPVVHIVGTPPRVSQDKRLLIHHTFNDGEYGRFREMHRHVTVAQAKLYEPRLCPGQIDAALRECLVHSRPVYIEVPVDMVGVEVADEGLRDPITVPQLPLTAAHRGIVRQIIEKVQKAKRPMLLVDGETRPMGIMQHVQQLMELNWPTYTTPYGKGLLEEDRKNFHGVYMGTFDKPETQEFVKSTDLILNFGPHFSGTNSYAYSSIPDPEKTITFTGHEIRMGADTHRDIQLAAFLEELNQQLLQVKAQNIYESYPTLARDHKVPFSDIPANGLIAQDCAWKVLANFLRPGDIVLGETGTPGYGVREMPLPKHTRLFNPVTWLSIGYMLPGAQGCALAQRELIKSSEYNGIKDGRTVLFIGDGSFQMTVQEIGTIIRHNLDVVIFLINNDGYTIERCIHGVDKDYNDVPKWRYLEAPSFFGAAKGCYTAAARTYGELEKVLNDEKLVNGKGLRMVEIFMDKDDAPKGPLSYFMEQQKAGKGILM